MIDNLKSNDWMFSILDEFQRTAWQFENALIDFYNLDKSSIKDFYFIRNLIPRKGGIPFSSQHLQYHFHGSGCTFNYGKIRLQYNSSAHRNHTIEISVWPVHKFINTKYPEITISEDEVFSLLEEQVNENHLIKVGPNKGLYWIHLDMNWENFSYSE